MNIDIENFYYSPISHSNVALIYPWNNWTIDLLALLPFRKQRKKLISNLEKILDHKHFFLTNSGSAALVLAIQSLHLAPNSEVLITAFNCSAVIDSIITAGTIPVFIDTNHTGGIDLKSAQKAISEKTKAIIVTNIFGLVDDLLQLKDFCKSNNIIFINDLAQTFENINLNQILNKYGDLAIYSFGPEKHLFSLGGGCLIVNNKSLIKQVGDLYPKTINNDTIFIFLQRLGYYGKFLLHRYFPKLVKFNSQKSANDISKPHLIHVHRMNNSQLFSLITKLRTYKKYYISSKRNFDILQSRLKREILENKNKLASLPLYATLVVEKTKRYQLACYLDRHHIATTWNYLPLYYYDAYKKYKIVENKETERLWGEVLSIPFRYPIDTHALKRIAEVVNSY